MIILYVQSIKNNGDAHQSLKIFDKAALNYKHDKNVLLANFEHLGEDLADKTAMEQCGDFKKFVHLELCGHKIYQFNKIATSLYKELIKGAQNVDLKIKYLDVSEL